MYYSINFEHKSSVLIVIYHDGKKYKKATGIKCKKEHFNATAQNFQYISRKDPNSMLKNQTLRDIFYKIEKALTVIINKKIITPANIRMVLESKNEVASDTLQAIGKEYINDRIHNYGTARRYKYYLSQFFNEYYPDILISSITVPVLNEMKTKLTREYKGSNTVVGYFKFLRSLVNYAIDKGIVIDYPFGKRKFQIPTYKQPERTFLSEEEVERIMNEDIDDPSIAHVRDYFIFGCLSGLRYSDIMRFTPDWIANEKLYFSDAKTKTQQYVPLYPKLKEYADKIVTHPKYSNVDCNRKLKLIALLVKINKPLSMHVARHTFAVNYLNKGGSMEVLSKLLGHASTRTTAIYGKITNTRIDSEFNKIMK